jgi:hypothetical protein
VIQIVGREKVTVAERDFDTIRILMVGKDGKDGSLEIRRTTWFAPKFGVVKEEKVRYLNDEMILKESFVLKAFQLKYHSQSQ